MRTAICPINGKTYEAVSFEQDEHFDYIRTSMVCPQCSQPAFFRGVTQNGREACFGARHEDGCDLASSECDDMDTGHQNVEEEIPTVDQRIVVDFNSTGASIDNLLSSLLESDEFKRSTGIIEVPGHGEFAKSDFFVNFDDVTDDYIGSYRGFWGLIPDVRLTENTMWLNTGGPHAPCANLDKKYFETIYQRFNITDAAEISGGHILVFGELKKGKNSDKKFVLISDPSNFTLRLSDRKSELNTADRVTVGASQKQQYSKEGSVQKPLSKLDIMEMCESVDTIAELTFKLRKDIAKHIRRDNPDYGIIDFQISQIYDLAFVASMHAYTLMYPQK